MKNLHKWLLCISIVTVVVTIVAIFANFKIALSYGHETSFTTFVSSLFVICWIILICSFCHSRRALTLFACYWIISALAAAIPFLLDIAGALVVPTMIVSSITLIPMMGFSRIDLLRFVFITLGFSKFVPSIVFLEITIYHIMLCISIAFLILIAIVAIWQWHSKRKNAAK